MGERVIPQSGHSAGISTPEELARFEIAGRTASQLFYPEDNAQVAEILTAATREGRKVLIAGNNSQRDIGAAIGRPDWVISVAKMNSVVEHDVADLIVTVQAGARLPFMQNYLRESNQQLSLEIPGAETRTLGGIVATNSPNVWHSGYGGCRDSVLGMKVVLPDGSLIRAGGKTVKNVAGYDLSKLFIGTFGTLGAITEITFKLSPIPASRQSLIVTFDQVADAFSFSQKISAMNFLISRYEYYNRACAAIKLKGLIPSPQLHGVILTVIGHPAMVQDSSGRISDIASGHGAVAVRAMTGNEEEFLPKRIAENGISSHEANARFSLRITVPKAKLAEAAVVIEEFAGQQNLTAAIQAHMFSGVLDAAFTAQEVTGAIFQPTCLESIREKIAALHGSVTGLLLPLEHRTPEMVWGKTGGHFGLMAAIKRKYDPNGILVAGRFVGGL
jgi:glycolate oxidase FAD binding subunit